LAGLIRGRTRINAEPLPSRDWWHPPRDAEQRGKWNQAAILRVPVPMVLLRAVPNPCTTGVRLSGQGHGSPEHPRTHRQHVHRRAQPACSRERDSHPAQDGVREPDRQHERPHGAGDDRGRRRRRPPAARRRRRRIYGRQHGRVAVAGMRRERSSASRGQLRCLRAREARSHGDPWCPLDRDRQRQRQDDGTAHERHDRGRLGGLPPRLAPTGPIS
jgi:hypothetical protein